MAVEKDELRAAVIDRFRELLAVKLLNLRLDCELRELLREKFARAWEQSKLKLRDDLLEIIDSRFEAIVADYEGADAKSIAITMLNGITATVLRREHLTHIAGGTYSEDQFRQISTETRYSDEPWWWWRQQDGQPAPKVCDAMVNQVPKSEG
jgi:hypothetical protein